MDVQLTNPTVVLSLQYGPKSLKNIFSSALLILCYEKRHKVELLRQKELHPRY